mgnify:CR=1 FL=1
MIHSIARKFFFFVDSRKRIPRVNQAGGLPRQKSRRSFLILGVRDALLFAFSGDRLVCCEFDKLTQGLRVSSMHDFSGAQAGEALEHARQVDALVAAQGRSGLRLIHCTIDIEQLAASGASAGIDQPVGLACSTEGSTEFLSPLPQFTEEQHGLSF